MISKKRFFNLLREDMKNRAISIVLSSIVEFIFFPVAILIYFSNSSYSEQNFVNIRMVIENTFTPAGIFIAIVGAVICAYASFDYVFSKSKVDFYNSVPFSRNKIFWARYLNGILVYLIPLLVFLTLSIPIYAVNVGITIPLIKELIKLIISGFLSFMIIYNLFILGCMLSGNFANAGFFAIVVSVVSGLFVSLIIAYMSTFFKTFTDTDTLTSFAGRITPGYYAIFSKDLKQNLIPSILIIAVLLVINYLLFIKRRFENSNAGGIYIKVNSVVRFCLELLISLSVGLFFCVITEESFIWLIFGIALGGVISHILINALFNMSIKGALKNPAGLIAAVVLSIIISGLIKWDILGYDRYVPDTKNLASIDINFDYFNELVPSRRAIFNDRIKDNIQLLEKSDFYDNYYILKSMDEYKKNRIRISDDLSVACEFLNLAKMDTLNKPVSAEDLGNCTIVYLKVTYNLKNKSKVSRAYTIYISENDQKSKALTKLFNSKGFRKGIKDSVLVRDFDKLDSIIYLDDYMYDKDLFHTSATKIKKEYYSKIYEAMKRDLAGISINEWFRSNELWSDYANELRFVYKIDEGYDVVDIPISSALRETVNILNSMPEKQGRNLFDYDEVDSIKIYSFDKSGDEKTVKDKELIRQIITAVIEDLKNDDIVNYEKEISLEMFVRERHLTSCQVLINGRAYEILKNNGLIR